MAGTWELGAWIRTPTWGAVGGHGGDRANVGEVGDQRVGGGGVTFPHGQHDGGGGGDDRVGGAHPPGRPRPGPALVIRISDAVDGRRAKDGLGSGWESSARGDGGLEVGLAPGHLGQLEAFQRGVGGPHVADAEAIGDDRAAPDDRLEHGQAGAGVHEHVGGGEHITHPVGEAHDPQPRLAGEQRATLARVLSLRPHRVSTVASSKVSAARVAPARSPTPQPPPETAITRPSAGKPSARRASARERAAKKAGEVGGLAQRTLPGPAIRSTSSADSGWVMKCRSIPGWAQNCRPARSVIDE